MDTYDIFKKLTTNLKFENKKKASSNVGPKAIEPSTAPPTLDQGAQKPSELSEAKQNGASKKNVKKGATVSKEAALESILTQYKEKVSSLDKWVIWFELEEFKFLSRWPLSSIICET